MPTNELIHAQRAFFQSGATKNLQARQEQLRQLQRLLTQNSEKLAAAVHADFQKSLFDVYTTEIGLVQREIEQALGEIPRWASRKKVPTDKLNWGASGYIYPEPLGLSLVIAPWNYPLQLALAPMVAAIAAGNTVLLKPSEWAPNTAESLLELLRQMDPRWVAAVQGGVETTQELLEYRWDKIFFTGSVAVGKIVYAAAAKHLTPVTLELGGKSPVLIDKEADLDWAARRIVWGKFLNAGQTCVAPDYVLVHRSDFPALLEKMRLRIAEEDYSTANGNYTQIIHEKHFDRLLNILHQSTIYSGGEYDRPSRYIAPTLLEDSFDGISMAEEIFGPLLPVIPYDQLDDALDWIRQKSKPLAFYFFGKNQNTQKKVLQTLAFGGGCINDVIMHLTHHHLPFGGVGDSGIGNYHGYAGFRAFSHEKSVLERNWWAWDNPLQYGAKKNWKLRLARWWLR